jgi:hypothetical protein
MGLGLQKVWSYVDMNVPTHLRKWDPCRTSLFILEKNQNLNSVHSYTYTLIKNLA